MPSEVQQQDRSVTEQDAMAALLRVAFRGITPLAFQQGLQLGPQPRFLPPDVKAQYEAGFAVLAINADFSTERPPPDIMTALNHETYHHLQTVCTGFGWQRGEAIRRIANRYINGAKWRNLRAGGGFPWLSLALYMLPQGVRRRIDAPRWERMIKFVSINNRLARVAGNADPADPSLAATECPGLFAGLDRLQTTLWQAGADGVADGHVMEGTAVAHGILVEAVALDGPAVLTAPYAEKLDASIAGKAAEFGPEYATLLQAARARCGGPASLFLLPAAALALHYERPGAAFLPMVDALHATEPAAVLPAARALSAQLPNLPRAGRVLGTARQAAGWRRRDWPLRPWRKRDDGLHDVAFEALQAGDFDEVSALGDPLIFDNLAGLVRTAVARYNDRVIRVGSVSAIAAAYRVAASGLVLRARTRRGYERETEAELLRSVQEMINGVPT